AASGKKLYVLCFCWSRHGSQGRAGGTAPAITPSTRSADDLIKYVRKPRGAMPPYTSKSISDRELADIAAFLRAVPKDPDPKSIPLLNPQRWVSWPRMARMTRTFAEFAAFAA